MSSDARAERPPPWWFDVRTDQAARVAWLRAARRVLGTGFIRIGLLPASDEGELFPQAVALGVALADADGGTAAVVVLRGSGVLAARSPDDGPLAAHAEVAGFLARRVSSSLLVLAPALDLGAGPLLPALRRLLEALAGDARHLVVDLTGFEAQGEHLAAAALLDGVALVAWEGRTSDLCLMEAAAGLPGERCLGVVLVADPP